MKRSLLWIRLIMIVTLLLLLASCSSMRYVPKHSYIDYDFNDYYWDPFPYGRAYGFGIGYDFYSIYHRHPMNGVLIIPKDNYVKPKTNKLPENRQDRGIYYQSEGSKPLNRKIIP